MVPLINVVFLLLIFFMLAGAITPPDFFEITPPRSSRGDSADDQTVSILLSADGRLAVDGREVSDADLRRLIRNRLPKPGEASVRLKADSRVEADRLLAVMEVLREAGLKKLILFTALGGS